MVSPEGAWHYDVIPTPAGINEFNNAVEFARVYPNPASSLTMVHLEAYSNTNATVRVYDLMGKLVTELHNGQLSLGSNKFFFDASELTAGVYTVRVATPHTTIQQKVVVQ